MKKVCFLLCVCSIIASCGTIQKLPSTYAIQSIYSMAIQNLDESAKCDKGSLTAYYNGFAIEYSIDNNTNPYFTIINKTNRDLIIDKSKCFVLYDGVARELFKDVRQGRVTTYNNVQDAINNVQTNESSVTMSIPAYSKWAVPLGETNIQALKYPIKYLTETNAHIDYTPNTTILSTVEFIIPYTYDYALAKWGTARNRIYLDRMESKTITGVSIPSAAWNYTKSGYYNGGIIDNGKGYYRNYFPPELLKQYSQVVDNNQRVRSRWTWLGVISGLAISGAILIPLMTR